MKKIALIGASGFIGSAILKELLNRGHFVTAIVRNPDKITLRNPNLKVIQGDVMSEDTVTNLVKGSDIVISAYNPGWTNPNIAKDTTNAYKSIINGVKKAEVKRLLIVGGAGSLYVSPERRIMDTGAIPESYMPAIRALAEVLYGLQSHEHQLDWAFFSPASTIEPGERTGKFRLGNDYMVKDENGESRISVEDYAVAMVDEVEKPQHHKVRFTIGY